MSAFKTSLIDTSPIIFFPSNTGRDTIFSGTAFSESVGFAPLTEFRLTSVSLGLTSLTYLGSLIPNVSRTYLVSPLIFPARYASYPFPST